MKFYEKKKKKNIKQRYLFKNLEKKRLILKIISKNCKFSKNIRFKIKKKWFLFNNNSSITRIKNICILTGRSRSIYRILKISRIKLRDLVSKKLLPGICKYSW